MGDFQPDAQVKGFAGSNLIALLCSRYETICFCVSIIKQMYKVFFNGRMVIFNDDFGGAFRKNSGLFYKYHSREQLAELVEAFSSLHTIDTLYLFHTDLDFLRKKFISCFELVKAAGGVVFNPGGEFLVMKRRGLWDLPKGKNEKGESPDETALREVTEECGIVSLKVKRPLIKTYHTFTLDGRHILKETEWFEMHTDLFQKGEPQAAEEITELRWVKKGKGDFILENTFPSVIDVLRYVKAI
jgi:8-oxo-dGTP pyrophosphatase MutT (NUDIX family)